MFLYIPNRLKFYLFCSTDQFRFMYYVQTFSHFHFTVYSLLIRKDSLVFFFKIFSTSLFKRLIFVTFLVISKDAIEEFLYINVYMQRETETQRQREFLYIYIYDDDGYSAANRDSVLSIYSYVLLHPLVRSETLFTHILLLCFLQDYFQIISMSLIF